MNNILDIKNSILICDDFLNLQDAVIREALLIRLVEEKFLQLFSEGRMNGTVHTCVGQEFCAVAVAGQLLDGDWVTSNHRCHGHFISKTKNWQSLIDELMGLKSGACQGVGSSQHLFADGFLSNGPQAALIPVASGIALDLKRKRQGNIAVSYIGEGTLGEGVIYESLNMVSLFELPHLIVCENNFYSQSTPQQKGVAGEISHRPEAFGVKHFQGNTWDPVGLLKISKDAINYVRTGKPAFLTIQTYRLNPHSKGDDNRDLSEVEYFRKIDPLSRILEADKWKLIESEISKEIEIHINDQKPSTISFEDYVFDQLPRVSTSKLVPVQNENIRMIQALNLGYFDTLKNGAVHVGEDIEDPYGGAFKVTKGFSSAYPESIIGTPISESCLIGLALGMSIMGHQAYAEIMFGDFMTHALDQIVSNASKIHHMYAFKLSAPLRIRTPMGGKRGYGPTHSQSLEKLFLGIDNVGVIAYSSLIDPRLIINDISTLKCPLILVESKVDYGKTLWQEDQNFRIHKERKKLGSLLLSPLKNKPTLTIVSYGETARHIADNLELFFIETDFIPELVCVVQLHPLDLNLITRSVERTGKILIVEDGSISYGFGAEILGRLMEGGANISWALRVGAEPVPIPSVNGLELEVLPTIKRVIRLVIANSQGVE